MAITEETESGYSITAVSRAETDGEHHSFTVVHNIGGIFARTCDADGKGEGAGVSVGRGSG